MPLDEADPPGFGEDRPCGVVRASTVVSGFGFGLGHGILQGNEPDGATRRELLLRVTGRLRAA
ncbi:hypothetical protein [Amycolatopsis sp. NPDC004169]|uniref:hypothetical protein n=1 Tax=Amycolatopsis sp. NPDC004169 TaxID=3154453 RepID=UPI0033B5F065